MLRAASFQPGDFILFGKFRNKRGRIVRLFEDERGIPYIEVEPVPKGRKKNRVFGLYTIRKMNPEQVAEAKAIQKMASAVRFVLAKRNLEQLLGASLPSLRSGDPTLAIKALDDFWTFLDVGEEPGEIGTVLRLNAEWLYALGPRDRSKVTEIIREAKDLRRSLPQYKNQGPVPSRMVERLEALADSAAWLDKKVHSDDDSFSHGDFTIIPMPGVSRAKLGECLEALDKAAEILRRKFPQLLYGKVYVNRAVSAGVANYVAAQDTIQLGLRASKTVGDVHALCHEFGHRYEHKFWKDKGQRDTFWKLSTDPVYESIDFNKVTRAKLADEFIDIADGQREGKRPTQSALLKQWLDVLIREDLATVRRLSQAYLGEPSDLNRKALWEHLAIPSKDGYSVMTNKIVREPIAVTPYGKKNWKENFAEAFAFYVMGKPLPPEISAIMERLS